MACLHLWREIDDTAYFVQRSFSLQYITSSIICQGNKMAGLEIARDFGDTAILSNHLIQSSIDGHNFHNGDSAAISCVLAAVTASGVIDRHRLVSVQAKKFHLGFCGYVLLSTMNTQAAGQALAYNANDIARHEFGAYTHID